MMKTEKVHFTVSNIGMCFLALLVLCHLPTVNSLQPNNDLPDREYIQLGDINLGAIFAITQYSSNNLCGERIRFPLLQQYVESIVFAVKEINKNATLLPNITLGYVILDDCVKPNTAVAQALRFLARKETPEICNHDPCPDKSGTLRKKDYFEVAGVIGPQKSENTIAVSYVFGGAKVPQLSFLSTSDELSNKASHPYFLRIVPPDHYQAEAILSFIMSNGWTYISILYSAGSYGEYAYSNMKLLAAKMGICIATHRKTDISTTSEEYLDIIRELVEYPRARVVVAFLGGAEMVGIFTAVDKLNVSRMFIWVGSDGWSERLTMLKYKHKEALYGSFTTMIYSPPVPAFDEYFAQIKPCNTQNPWFHEFWEYQFNCTVDCKACDTVRSENNIAGPNDGRQCTESTNASTMSSQIPTCDLSKNITSSPGFHTLALIANAMDSVYAFAYAIHDLLAEECPGAVGKVAQECITGESLLGHLKNVSFEGYSGHIKFDKEGNLQGKYMVNQILPGNPYEQVPVKLIDTTGAASSITLNPISWKFLAPLKPSFGPNAVLPPPPFPLEDKNTPPSVCSRLCGVGEYIIPKDLPCCWECRYCRDNEITINNQTDCQTCPILFWPDPKTNLTTCQPIPPDYPKYTDAVVIFEICASCTGILVAVGVLVAYFYHRDAPVIKASSRELSFLQIIAITVGYVTMLLYVAPPTHNICAVSYWLFCFSFDLLYVPLLVKAIRIYRIFHAAAKGTRGLKLISPLSQVVICCCIVTGQVLISTLVTGLQRPSARLTQPVSTERYVELSCDITLSGLATFLSYNLTMVLLCSIFAFKTRKLPDNFNESRFMSMCVTTTLVIWLAFIPTFLTSSRQYLKTLLLTLALLLNHSVALIFLFLSKLYAVVCLKHETEMDEVAGNGVRIPAMQSRFGSLPHNSLAYAVRTNVRRASAEQEVAT